LSDSQELLDKVDSIKRQLQENMEPDGKCRFNVQEIKWILQLTEITLQNSVKSFMTG